MIFQAVEDFKTISLPCMHEFTLTLWCRKIRCNLFLYFVPFIANISFSLRQKHEGCVALQTQKVEVEVEPLAYP